jgi:CheY-like chemotaxis protein
MPDRPKAVAFDVDTTSLVSLREALPGWQIEIVNGATAASVARTWNPGAADLLVVGVRGTGTDTLGLCRFLAFCTSYSEDARQEQGFPLGPDGSRRRPARRTDAPLLVLVSAGQETLVEVALEAGAHSCLVRPIHSKEVTSMLAHARAGNQPGRHTLNLEGAQRENLWRDDGGEG